jgi:hypothetical protein
LAGVSDIGRDLLCGPDGLLAVDLNRPHDRVGADVDNSYSDLNIFYYM